MSIDLNLLINDVRNGLSDIPFDLLDDKLIFNDLQDAYDFILMVVADEIEERYIRRCLIRYATFISYRNFTSLAERKLSSMPQTASLQLQTMLMQTYNCLTLISKYPLNPDLSLAIEDFGAPVAGSLSDSMIVAD